MTLSVVRLLPGFGIKAAAGLVIRPGAVELLELKGKTVSARVSIPLESKAPAYVTAAIRKACETTGIKTKKFAVSILSPDVLLRFREFKVDHRLLLSEPRRVGPGGPV